MTAGSHLLHPPAGNDDFAARPDKHEAFARGWDAIVGNWFDQYAGLEGGGFYDPRTDTTPGSPDRATVPWDAFPRPIGKWFEDEEDPDVKRWRSAEALRPRLFGGQSLRRVVGGSLAEPVNVVHRQQDEYCEWFVHRDTAGRIARVTFTCEGPEYWRFLAGGTRAFFPDSDERSRIVEGDIDMVAALYRRHVDPSVLVEDLLWPHDVAAYDTTTRKWSIYGKAGTYNPFNKWTTTHGAMHLTHPANTLRGVFTVAGRAAVARKGKDGTPVEDAEAIVCCSGFGEPNRSSDPSIGSAVNGLVRDGMSVSLADPVGLYIAGIDLDAFQGPRGGNVDDAWRVDRGDAARRMVLRATFAPPPGARFTVDKIRVGGAPITYGGQIADEVQMVVTALAKRRSSKPFKAQTCVTKCCEHPRKPGVVTVVGLKAACSKVDWATLAPVAGEGAAPPIAMALAAAPEETGGLDDVQPAWALRHGGDEPEHR